MSKTQNNIDSNKRHANTVHVRQYRRNYFKLTNIPWSYAS